MQVYTNSARCVAHIFHLMMADNLEE